MSPVNVHVNRMPVGGSIRYYQYHPGKYLVAWHPKSSTENERTTVVAKMKNGTEVLFRQIAGAVARRIKCYVKEGQTLEQGQEFGYISSVKCNNSYKNRTSHYGRKDRFG
jgi:phosphatidylserine decarboxylase